MADSTKKKRWPFVVLFVVPILFSLITPMRNRNQEIEEVTDDFSFFLQQDGNSNNSSGSNGGFSVADQGPVYDFYQRSCPQAESLIRSRVAQIYSRNRDLPAALLRLLFHDCFIMGCDASILLDNTTTNRSDEKHAIPNKTLRGFEEINMIKEDLENACPGVVSCADTLALATRDGIVLIGGPFYPVFTGRRDSNQSYHDIAMADIPKPTDNINRILNLFALRGFDERETVSLLGAHNIGKISCDFIQDRLRNFAGTGRPDPSIAPDFLNEMLLTCQDNSTARAAPPAPTTSREGRAAMDMSNFLQDLSASVMSPGYFGANYYQNLLRGRGTMFSDQQLMADTNTARLVRFFALDGAQFRRDFSRAMVKMSNYGVLTGTQGLIRTNCSLPAGTS